MEKEIWVSIEFCNSLYEVSTTGRVRSVRSGKILIPYINHGGYEMVGLCWRVGGILYHKKFFVHRLVGLVFVKNPFSKPQINHIDCNKRNNKVENLEWVTNKENSEHGQRFGKVPKKTKFYIKKGHPKNRFNAWKPIINKETGVVYSGVMDASLPIKTTVKYLRRMLVGERRNTTPYEYI